MGQTIEQRTTQEFYSLPQLARITSESVAVWRKRILRRQISYTKCGGNVRVSSRTLERWLGSRTVAAAPDSRPAGESGRAEGGR